jgi:hypothetical protein
VLSPFQGLEGILEYGQTPSDEFSEDRLQWLSSWQINLLSAPHRPHHPRHFIGESDNRDVTASPTLQREHPTATAIVSLRGAAKSGSRPVNQESAQVSIAAFADAK